MSGSSRAGTDTLAVRLLGPLEVWSGAHAVAVGGPKQRTLLAALALEVGRVVSVDRLVESLWPGETPETAAHAVQVHVSQLRKALGADVIATRPPGYALELELEHVDVRRFARLVGEGQLALEAGDPAVAAQALREALALWRGPALADFAYEPFAQTEIARLEELRLAALEGRIEADLALGRHAELVPELEALVESQPLRERLRGQLMLALYRCGRQADALAVYRSGRERLVGELGIEPGPDLRTLEAAVLRHDKALMLGDTAPAPPALRHRRLVTILFVDVVAPVALAEALDPETLGNVLRRYFEAASEAVVRHGGTVEAHAGETIMAAFGIPVSHEDDAARAARAALDVRAAVAALGDELEREQGRRLDVRIAFETGEVATAETASRVRLVTGEAVGIAAELERAAGAGEILVGELAGRLIDHAATLAPLEPLEIAGKREPVAPFRLLELIPASPAFEERLDAPLVGRRKELAALRRLLRRATETGAVQAALVVGSPGVGKSRLAGELVRRAKGVTTLLGHCLPYGDGITFWPLREVVGQAPPGEERDEIIASLESETPPPAAEIALLFRRFCEVLSRERPLVLVLDDLHWAEPTFLDLVEQLVDRGVGPIFVVCLAREEIDVARPGFLAGHERASRNVLEPLSAEDTDTLLDGLGGGVLESDQRTRIVEGAEGNPFFLEQLVALTYEGGLGRRLPPTVQAVLAARLDRLGPGERAVLERATVIGKRFRIADVVALLEPAAVPTIDAHVRALVAGGFVRPTDGDRFRFRHVLVQEAVYRSAPKRLRAELHERFVDLCERRTGEEGDADELAGYHLEQAYRLRTELGESDRRTEKLAEDAGRRLGAAGVRALKRGDVPAAVSLLRRASSLEHLPAPLLGELLCDMAIVLHAAGEVDDAGAALERALAEARAAGDRRIEARARLELEHVRLPRTPGSPARGLLDAADAAIPVFEAAGDDRCLGRALLLAGWIHGGRYGRHRLREEAAERALEHYRRSSWPTATCLGEIANALYYGPTPAPAAIERCTALLHVERPGRLGHAFVDSFLGGLVAQSGDFDQARSLVRSARAAFDELGHRASAVTVSGTVIGDVELLADDAAVAEETLRWVCHELLETRAFSHLASRAGDLAEALYRQGRYDEAAEWVATAEPYSAEDDLDARLLWMPVRAKLTARRGDVDEALAIASRAVDLVEATDATNRRAAIQADLAEVLLLAGRVGDARDALARAVSLYEEKGNVAGAARVRALRDDPALV